MLLSPTSEAGIDGNFLEALDALRGDEFTGDGLSGDDLGDEFTDAGLSGDNLDGEDLAREGRGFRRVDMVSSLS